MELKEIYLFARIEKEHFFYRARRELVKYWLKLLFPDPGKKPVVIDAGAGSGILLKEIEQVCSSVIGCDLFFDPKISKEYSRIVKANATTLPFPDNFSDATIALDLLEHLENDLLGLKELKRITQPGGYIILNVPAFWFLFSDWDQAVGHRRRYNRKQLKALTEDTDLEIVFIRYVNSLPFLPIFLYRQLRSGLGLGKGERLEDKLPPLWLNQLLLKAFIAQGKRGSVSLPFGVSLFAILEKPEN